MGKDEHQCFLNLVERKSGFNGTIKLKALSYKCVDKYEEITINAKINNYETVIQ